jgi:ABC-type Fe3+-hydroxamate transport system substrate-binding protein
VRIVSLLPSATEIVYALGLGDQLVGVTFECDEPASARLDKAVIVGGRDTSGMSPSAIDAYVRSQLARGEDLYTLDAGALAALEPDLILTQDLCRVCALPAGHVAEALCYLGCTAEAVSLDPHSLDDVLATILTIGERTGAQRQAEPLVAAFRRRLALHRRALDPGSGHGRRGPSGRSPPWSALGAVQLGADRRRAARRGRGGSVRLPPRRCRSAGRAGSQPTPWCAGVGD